jgi:hypothetical protein
MPTQTSKEIQEDSLRKAYFDYWRIKNNPRYIEFWKEVKSMGGEGKANGNLQKDMFDPPLLKEEGYGEWFMRTNGEGRHEYWFVEQMKKFKVWFPLPDPLKRIDWMNFIKTPDPDIIESMNYAYIYSYRSQRKLPIKIEIDGADDDKEIIRHVSRQVNFMRHIMGIWPLGRDHIGKFHLYAQTWDQKICDGKSFPEIAEMTNAKPTTVKMRFYKAFKLIYEVASYDPDLLEFPPEPLCSDCDKREICKSLCFVADREVKRREKYRRELQTVGYKSISDQRTYQEWLGNKNP